MSEHILWETIKEQNEKIAELEQENRLLGERCNQLLKDKGELTDHCQRLIDQYSELFATKEQLSQDNSYLKTKIKSLEEQIADIKANCDLAIEGRDIKIMELEKACEGTEELLYKQIEATYKLYKENAELKEKVNILDNCDRLGDVITEAYKEQLTKAKEHIRTLISCLIDWVQEGDKDYCYIEDAEQFLKEIEK